MKIYISGPITGQKNKNKHSFDELSIKLKKLGYEVLNPFDLDFPGFNPLEKWEEYMKRDLIELLKCDAVCLLPGWEESRGAKLEVLIAQTLNLKVCRLCGNDICLEPIAVDIEMTPLLPSHLWNE